LVDAGVGFSAVGCDPCSILLYAVGGIAIEFLRKLSGLGVMLTRLWVIDDFGFSLFSAWP
jgi:hypothetical protein